MLKKLPFAAFSLAAGLGVFFSTSCENNELRAELWQGEQESMELRHDLELKKYRWECSNVKEATELNSLLILNQSQYQKIKSLRHFHVELSADLKSLEKQLIAAQADIIRQQRQKATGSKFQTLSVAHGRIYRDATVASIDNTGVTIRHADGSARLRYADLSEKHRDLFGLEKASSQQAEQEESQDSLAYEQWIDRTLASSEQKKAAQIPSPLPMAKNTIRTPDWTNEEARPLAQPARRFGMGSSRYYSSRYYNNYRSSRYRTFYYVNTNYVQVSQSPTCTFPTTFEASASSVK